MASFWDDLITRVVVYICELLHESYPMHFEWKFERLQSFSFRKIKKIKKAQLPHYCQLYKLEGERMQK